MDTTLRDGEQTSGVSFSASEKLALAQSLLTEVKVDRVEVASARVSAGELDEDGETAGLSDANAEHLRGLALAVRLGHAELVEKYQTPRGEVVPAFSITSW